jgi:hypothetical protein
MIAGNMAARTLQFRSMVVLGGVIVSGGMLLMATLNASSPVLMPVAGMAIIGLGLGVTMPLMGLAVQNALPESLLGVASASTQFFRQIGGTLGMAVGGTLITGHLHGDLQGRLPAELVATAPPDVLRQLETPALLLSRSEMTRMQDAFGGFGASGPALYADTVTAMRGVLADGLHEVFLGGFVVAVIALLVSAFLPRMELRARIEPADEVVGTPVARVAAVKAPACRIRTAIRTISGREEQPREAEPVIKDG